MQNPEPGLRTHDRARATPGYTLFSAIRSDRAFLIDMEGRPVHEWQLQGLGGVNLCQLTGDGNLFVTQATLDGPPLMAGKGGLLREYDWDGNIVWEHYDENHHHDARRLENGNTLYIAWDLLDDATARRVQGGLPGTEVDGKIYGDLVREIDPSGRTVWEWRIRDIEIEKYPICGICDRAEFGHANTCAPLDDGNVMLSFRVLNLICIVDRDSGQIVWEMCDPILGHQHDCHFIDNGNVLVFANGFHGRTEDMFSHIFEIEPQTKEIVWRYDAKPPQSFYSANISGVQRLWSGNTFICEGARGCLFEVTPEGDTVWEYLSPHTAYSRMFGTELNWIFRARRYAPDAPELKGRV
ncbi:MAG: aryl-sulfate sulfotransferase [Rhodospirillaceae bacterium]|nr:aryl-sulfate sulfotransferase [Rhodospirillaceae bacterium]